MQRKNALTERFAMIIIMYILDEDTGGELEVSMRSFHDELNIGKNHKDAVNLLCINNVVGHVYSIDTQTRRITERTEVE